MHALALAKRRSRRRRREAGAAMFVIAMAIAVLASVGIYALAAASSEVRTAGNERQSTQTHYLATYGVIGATHELTATKAQFYLGLMLTVPDSPCVSLPGVAPTADALVRACRRIPASELGAPWTMPTVTQAYGGSVPLAPGQNPGTFGPTPMNGDFFLELTNPVQLSPPARYATDLHFCFIQFTATSGGITQPVFPAQPGGGAVSQFTGEGTEFQRARIVAGPVSCPR
jgi:hypothetical protein